MLSVSSRCFRVIALSRASLTTTPPCFPCLLADSGQADSSCFKEGHSEVDWSYSSRQAHEVAINTLTEGGLDGPVAEICSTQEILQALEQV